MKKICKTCKIEKLINLFNTNGNRYGKQEYRPSCKDCSNAKSRAYQKSRYISKGGRWNPEFLKEDGKGRCKKCNTVKSIDNFPKRYSDQKGYYRGTCKECIGPDERKRQRIIGQRNRDTYSDRYVKAQFVSDLGISSKIVPEEYIELTRKSLKMYRIVKSKINK